MIFNEKTKIIKLLKSLNNILDNKNLNKYWTNFSKSPIALYDNKHVYLINHKNPPDNFYKKNDVFVANWNSSFFGNSAISLNNQYTAIWDISTITPLISFERLTSLITHEMFHCYQFKSNYSKYPNELQIINYPFTKENIQFLMEERKYLLKAIFSKNQDHKISNINKFISCREIRKNLIGDYINYELSIESIEGTATYVECKSLIDTNYLPKDYILSTYSKNLEVTESFLNNFRNYCFYPGMAICLLLDAFYQNWHEEYMKSSLHIYEFFIQKFNYNKENIKLFDFSQSEYIISQYSNTKQKEFDDFYNNNYFKIVLEGNMRLCGFDPLNIVSIDNKILNKHFIKFTHKENEYFIKSPSMIIFNKNVFDITKVEFFTETKPTITTQKITLDNYLTIDGKTHFSNNTYLIELI